jgi:hypothetical protein
MVHDVVGDHPHPSDVATATFMTFMFLAVAGMFVFAGVLAARDCYEAWGTPGLLGFFGGCVAAWGSVRLVAGVVRVEASRSSLPPATDDSSAP